MPLPRFAPWIYYPALGLMTWDFIHHAFFRFHFVTGPSMSPTLNPDQDTTGQRDVILVLRRSPLTFRHALADLKRGDVVTLTSPHKPDAEGVKRVLALPGDTVLRDVRRVGKQEQQGGQKSLELGLQPLPPVVRVPMGSCWVEGDEWRKSRDSNDYGAVSLSLINGRVWGVVWPLSRFGRLREGEGVDSRTKVIAGKPPVREDMDFL